MRTDSPLSSNRNLYILPLVLGWLVLLTGGCAIIFEVPGPNTAVTFAVLLATVVISLLVTAVVMVVAEKRQAP
jgi:hypothetical protein